MEPMVVCALGIVLYCGYLTVKDIIKDLQQEGFFAKPTAIKCGKRTSPREIPARPKRTTVRTSRDKRWTPAVALGTQARA